LLRKQQKTLGGYFFLPHPVDSRTIYRTSVAWDMNSGVRSVNHWGVSVIFGVSVYVTWACSCSSDTVSNVPYV